MKKNNINSKLPESQEHRDRTVQLIKSSEPLHYYHMVTNMQMSDGNLRKDLLLYGTEQFASDFYKNTFKILNSDELTMLKIDKDVLNTIIDTDNQHFYRPLMQPLMFFNTDFEMDNRLIKGLIVIDDSAVGKNQLSIMLVYFDLTDMSENHIVFKIGNYENDDKFTKKELSFVNKLRNIVCNIIDLIEDDNLVDVRVVERDEKQNQKRAKRGKVAIPRKIVIKPKEEFRVYVDKYNKQREDFTYSHKFQVRGHWRHYMSDKYTIEKRGTKKWIKPFFKGEGILIKKDYEVRK